MADKMEKSLNNIPGKYYVDANCINCALCYSSASEFFSQDEATGTAYVSKQPMTDVEMRLCEEILKSCPVQAIGNDGEQK
jgi:ferredoxin